MRAITLSLVLAAASASADMPLQRGDTYSVWLAHDGQCLGSPSSKVALYTLIEERTLVMVCCALALCTAKQQVPPSNFSYL
jgi:hypothetical protein